MKELLPVISTLFQGKNFKHNGYDYFFYKVVVDEESFVFYVDCTTPTPDSSYAVQKIVDDIQEIITNKMKYISLNIAISIDYTVNGQEPMKNGYINYESLVEITEMINRELSFIKEREGNSVIEFKARFALSDKPYGISENDVYIRYNISISDFVLDGKPVKIKDRYFQAAFEDFANIIFESDEIREKSEGIMFEVLGPQMKIFNSDIYLYGAFTLKKVGGKLKTKFPPPEDTPKFVDLFEPL